MKNLKFTLSVLIIAILTGCNPNIHKTASTTNKVDKNLASLQYSMHTIINPEMISMDHKHFAYSAASKDLIYAYASALFLKDFNVHANNLNPELFNGYIKCKITDAKEKGKAWGIPFMILTCCLDPVAGHVKFEREYEFDIFDALGQKIATYNIKGTKNNTMCLYSTNNYDGTEVLALKNALKKLYEQMDNDAPMLNRKLNIASNSLRTELNKRINERDMVLADWINSGEKLPINTINEAIEEAPNDYVGWGLRIQYHMDHGSYNAALNDIETYCTLNPTCRIIMPYYLKANLLYRLGRKEDALESLVLAKAYHPDNEYIYILEGLIFTDFGIITNAIQSYEKAVSINPDDENSIKIIQALRLTKKELTQMKAKEEAEEWAKKSAALNQIATAYNNISTSLTYLTSRPLNNKGVNSNKNGNDRYNGNINLHDQNRTTTKVCSMCHGKGWVVGNSNMSFGNNKYCDECQRVVPESHSHDECPSCQGNGEITTIKH